MQEVGFETGTVLGRRRGQNGVQGRGDMADVGTKRAGSILLPECRLLRLRVGERPLQQLRPTPVARAEQAVKALHLTRSHLPIAIGNSTRARDFSVSGSGMARGLSCWQRCFGNFRPAGRSIDGEGVQELAGHSGQDLAGGELIASQKLVDNLAGDDDRGGAGADYFDRGRMRLTGEHAELTEHRAYLVAA